MKKIIASLLLSCLFFTVPGYYFLFKMQIAEAKSEMKTRLPQIKIDALTTFKLNRQQFAQLDWENDSEFSLNGKMYDVISTRAEGGTTVVVCVSDEKETTLVSAYQQLQKNNSSNKNTSGTFLKLITSPFLPSPGLKIQRGDERNNDEIFFKVPGTASAYRRVVSPPPRVC